MSERDRDKTRLQHTGVQCDSSFHELSARPWVPGEERAPCRSDWGGAHHEYPKHKGSSSAATTPRRSSLPAHHYVYSPNDVCAAPLGYEPEGSARVRGPRGGDSCSPPACLRWARALHHLLQDSDGVELFRRYLQTEAKPYEDALSFWFACEGLRKQVGHDKIGQLVKVIYKRFFMKPALPISDELRREVGKRVKETQASNQGQETVFDVAQAEVERLINDIAYPNFLKSDMYLQYIQSVQNPGSSEFSSGSGSSSSSSSISAREMAQLGQGSGLLPTLHEDAELVTSINPHIIHSSSAGSISGGHHTPTVEPVRLTKDLLLVTQKRRLDVRPKPEAYAGDGMSMYRSSRKQARLNRDPYIHQTLIPRTQRIDNKQCQPMKPEDFAAILIEKLEQVKREQDAQEKFDKKLMESDCMVLEPSVHMTEGQSRTLADAIREKLYLDDDNDQDILDQHVSRVWSDRTPCRSPGAMSPRSHSPARRHLSTAGYSRARRKEKDVFSTFSSDSGNVHDFPDPLDLPGSASLVKSKSMPEDAYLQDRFVRQCAARRSSSKKTVTDLTDSGVSVVSDGAPAHVPVPVPVPPAGKDSRVLTWLMESDRSGRTALYTHTDISGKHRAHRPSTVTSPNATRHRKTYSQSRSSSLERGSVSSSVGAERRREPAQPFVADPNMPPMPPPHTATQLEEARRRLMEDDLRTRQSRQRSGKSSHMADTSLSNPSTLRKCARGPRPPAPLGAAAVSLGVPIHGDEYTTVVFSFCDEQFPYRTKIPGTHITLKQFKEYLPKKGNYRFFFKTECEELDNQVIQEEISCDTDLLPLWEGKVMAQVKPTD